jgi:hypothetical protein
MKHKIYTKWDDTERQDMAREIKRCEDTLIVRNLKLPKIAQEQANKLNEEYDRKNKGLIKREIEGKTLFVKIPKNAKPDENGILNIDKYVLKALKKLKENDNKRN